MTDGLCLYGDLNDVSCNKCAERDRACEKREDGSVGCKQCQYSKLGCSLINRKKKSTRTPKTPKQDSAWEMDGEMLVVGEWPRMLVEIVGECMAPLVDQLAESKKASAEMAGIRSEVSRMANAMEDIASLLREKWSGESGKDLEVVSEVRTSADKGKGVAAVPEESSSSEDSDEEDEDDEDKADDDDVDMEEDGSVGGAGPIGIIGDPVAGPSSSSAA